MNLSLSSLEKLKRSMNRITGVAPCSRKRWERYIKSKRRRRAFMHHMQCRRGSRYGLQNRVYAGPTSLEIKPGGGRVSCQPGSSSFSISEENLSRGWSIRVLERVVERGHRDWRSAPVRQSYCRAYLKILKWDNNYEVPHQKVSFMRATMFVRAWLSCGKTYLAVVLLIHFSLLQ